MPIVLAMSGWHIMVAPQTKFQLEDLVAFDRRGP